MWWPIEGRWEGLNDEEKSSSRAGESRICSLTRGLYIYVQIAFSPIYIRFLISVWMNRSFLLTPLCLMPPRRRLTAQKMRGGRGKAWMPGIWGAFGGETAAFPEEPLLSNWGLFNCCQILWETYLFFFRLRNVLPHSDEVQLAKTALFSMASLKPQRT